MLDIRLLGKFEIKRDGKTIDLSSRPAQGLFAYLVLTAGKAHRREKLAGMLWPDSTDESARDYLRHGLWKIRKAIEASASKGKSISHIVTDDIHVSFNPESTYLLDVATIKNIQEQAAAKELAAALSVYDGELLPGFYDDWVLLEREHIQSVYEQKMARLISLLQDEQRWQDVLTWGEKWISLGQKPESAYRALMSAHAAKSDMSKVAAVYERCVRSLKEFGIEPSEQTIRLYERLKSGQGIPDAIPTLTLNQVPAKKEAESHPSNLPVPLTSFIGREKVLAEIIHLLAKNRLVTLMGSGGVGKTRLAIEAGNKMISKFRDGVWWVDLAGLTDPALVPQEVAQIVGAGEIAGQPMIDTLANHLKAKQALLVLDGCEHLIAACAQLAGRLLGASKNLKLLATSREALDILGETAFPIPSLSVPDMNEAITVKSSGRFESIQLFNERAALVQPGFEFDKGNGNAIVQICRRLSGMPLAIELAAARVKMMTVDEIARRLDDRFDLLTSGNRSALQRHQTLRATIDWSYELLSGPERILFCRLSVFAGGFTLEAAEQVCGHGELRRNNILDLLGRLVDKSLVIVDSSSPVSGTRYRLLETIREYTRQKLIETNETDGVRNAHLDYFIGLVEAAKKNTFGAESVQYHKRLDLELDDIRAAMDWSIQTRQATMAFRLGAALFYFWYNRSHIGSELQGQLKKALSLPEGAGRTPERANALNAMGFFYWSDVIPVNPRSELEEALSIGRELGNRDINAGSLRNLGLTESIAGRYEQARSMFEESLTLFEEIESPENKEYIWSLTFLGDAAFQMNDLESARRSYEQCVGDLRGIRDRNFLAYVVRRLGQLAWHQGDIDRAVQLCEESMIINRELGDERGMIATLAAFGGIATARGKFNAAAQLLGAVQALLEAKNIRLVHMDRLEYDRNVSTVREQMPAAVHEKAWGKGRGMTLEAAAAFALEGK